MIPKDLENPFTKSQVGHEWVPPPGNIPDLHKGVLGTTRRLLREARATGNGSSLLVHGEAGSGKSHIITQLRADAADDPATFVIRVSMMGAYPSQMWRFVRKQVAAELLRKRWHPTEPDLSGLTRIVRNRFPNWSDKGDTSFFGRLVGPVTSNNLQSFLSEFAAEHEFSYELRQVLPHVWDKDAAVAGLACDWLRGKTLAENDQKRLGLPTNYANDYEQEQTSRDVVTSLCRLAGEKTTLAICFDEVETMLTGVHEDGVALRSFMTLAVDLIAEPGPRLVVTFVRPRTTVLLREVGDRSYTQKMSQTEGEIPPLSQWEHVVQLVLARLHSNPGCRAARKGQRDQYWPFSEAFLRQLHDRNRLTLTPRAVILACMAEFHRLQTGSSMRTASDADFVLGIEDPPKPTGDKRKDGTANHVIPPATPSTPVAPAVVARPVAPAVVPPAAVRVVVPPAPLPPVALPPNPLDKLITNLWEKRRKHFANHVHAINTEKVFAVGLPWLAGVMGVPYKVSDDHDRRLADVNLVFRSTAEGCKSIGLSFCHQEPRVLWRRLDRLISQSQTAKTHGLLDRFIVIRSAAESLTDSAQERLEKLKRGGAFVQLVPKDQLADLAAFQELLTKAQTGDLTDDGQPVPVEAYQRWAKSSLTTALKQFGEALFTAGGSPPATPPSKSLFDGVEPIPTATGKPNRRRS